MSISNILSKRKVTKEEKIKAKRLYEEIGKKRYYCPYCRNIFIESGFFLDKKNNRYQCSSCYKKGFNDVDYLSQVNNGRNYNIKGKKEGVNIFIKKTVFDLAKKDFTAREIIKITFFSPTIINREMKVISIKSKSTEPLYNFLHNKLSIPKVDINNLLAGKNLSLDIKCNFIKSALKLGCTFDFIASVFSVSKRDIRKNMNNLELTLSDDMLTKIYLKRKNIKYVIHNEKGKYILDTHRFELKLKKENFSMA